MIVQADARNIPLADGSVQCVVTSPPYWGLRDYGTARWDGGDADCDHTNHASAPMGTMDSHSPDQPARLGMVKPYRDLCGKCGARRIDAQIGLEPTPEAYVATMVAVFREVRRVLRDDGTLWLNLGDSYSSGGRKERDPALVSRSSGLTNRAAGLDRTTPEWAKPKDLLGIPWRVAFALQADGWYLRSDIIWAKPNPMPESVTDRPTRSHEYLFLLAKRERYYYDADAIREKTGNEADPAEYANGDGRRHFHEHDAERGMQQYNPAFKSMTNPAGRNRRDVWTVNSEPTPEAHFATFPQRLIEPCILAGTSEKGCCAECGAPRVRVTEGEPVGDNYGKRPDNPRYGIRGSGLARPPSGASSNRQTTGWQPSCAHVAPVAPCIVFDPFLGSGTVGKVCERLGRRWAGLELSQDYISIARKRTSQLGLFTSGTYSDSSEPTRA